MKRLVYLYEFPNMNFIIYLLDLREYAILALRNILKENHENQAIIAELEPKEAVQTDELTEMGLKAKLVNGEVKLEKA